MKHFKNILYHGLIGLSGSLIFSKYYNYDANMQPKIKKKGQFNDMDNYLYIGFLP